VGAHQRPGSHPGGQGSRRCGPRQVVNGAKGATSTSAGTTLEPTTGQERSNSRWLMRRRRRRSSHCRLDPAQRRAVAAWRQLSADRRRGYDEGAQGLGAEDPSIQAGASALQQGRSTAPPLSICGPVGRGKRRRARASDTRRHEDIKLPSRNAAATTGNLPMHVERYFDYYTRNLSSRRGAEVNAFRAHPPAAELGYAQLSVAGRIRSKKALSKI